MKIKMKMDTQASANAK